MDKLPKGWKLIPFGQYTQISRGYNPPKSEFIYEPKEGYTRFIQIRDGSSDAYTVFVPESPKLHLASKEDILLVAYRHVGKAFKGMEGAFNVALCKIVINNQKVLNPDFLFYMIPSDLVKGELLKRSERALIPSMSVDHLKSIQIPLPPLPEQIHIVAKLDALFARIDKSITLLEENIKHTKGLMASVLEELFEKLKSKSTIYKIKQIAEIKGGKRLPKGESIQDEKTDYPYIRVTDFTNDGTIDVNSVKYMTQSVHEQIKRYIITSKDLYISIAGTIGKTGIIPKELENANLTENAARLVFKSNLKINNRFVYYFTLSDNFKDQVGLATKVVAQPKLALTRLAEVELPIPSIEIQNKEVKVFDELSRKFQEINTEQLSKLAYLKVLKSSILDRAFKGEL